MRVSGTHRLVRSSSANDLQGYGIINWKSHRVRGPTEIFMHDSLWMSFTMWYGLGGLNVLGSDRYIFTYIIPPFCEGIRSTHNPSGTIHSVSPCFVYTTTTADFPEILVMSNRPHDMWRRVTVLQRYITLHSNSIPNHQDFSPDSVIKSPSYTFLLNLQDVDIGYLGSENTCTCIQIPRLKSL